MWTLGKKIAAGFALAFFLLLVIGVTSFRSTAALTSTSRQVAHTHEVLEHVALLLSLMKDAETGQRGFVITGEDAFLEPYRAALADIQGASGRLRALTSDNPRQQLRMGRAEPLIAAKLAELEHVIDVRRTSGFDAAERIVRSGEGKRAMDELRQVLGQMTDEERALLVTRADEVTQVSSKTWNVIVWGTLVCLFTVGGAGFWITRSVTRQIGNAVQQVQSASAQLQAAADQQVSGAREQATAMTQITATVTELLATSRQIASSAQHVARTASDTASAAHSGDQTVEQSQQSVGVIRQQVDLIVSHMLELGRKSRQIGNILEVINEMADQTNLLAINATIEAVAAGQVGQRFAVVADEIRRLADRVGGSTKEIGGLVNDIRAAVDTTVMATEGGSKAVDAGTRQFGEVAQSFRRITGLVGTTTEAAKEIELSTRQQATAVEQVNSAVSNVAQAARESEVSSGQTLQTSSHLAQLSRDLTRLIQSRA